VVVDVVRGREREGGSVRRGIVVVMVVMVVISVCVFERGCKKFADSIVNVRTTAQAQGEAKLMSNAASPEYSSSPSIVA
jgi:hypothetical protein